MRERPIPLAICRSESLSCSRSSTSISSLLHSLRPQRLTAQMRTRTAPPSGRSCNKAVRRGPLPSSSAGSASSIKTSVHCASSLDAPLDESALLSSFSGTPVVGSFFMGRQATRYSSSWKTFRGMTGAGVHQSIMSERVTACPRSECGARQTEESRPQQRRREQ